MAKEYFKNYRDRQKERRDERMNERLKEVFHLEGLGFSVKELVFGHFRVNGQLDIFPMHNKYHHLAKNERGTYENMVGFVKTQLG